MRNKRWGKKTAIAVIGLAMVLGCASCAKSSEEYIAERLAEMNGGNSFYGDNEAEQQASDIMDGLMEDLAAMQEQKKEEKKTKKKTVTFGTWENNTYRNEYLGLSCTVDSDWYVYSDSELQEAPDEITGTMEESVIGAYMASQEYITDMMVENAKELTSINIVYDKLTKQEQEYVTQFTEKEIVAKNIENEKLLYDTYKQLGMTVNAVSSKAVDFLGEKRTALYTYSDFLGMPYYTIQISDHHSGEYATTITFASFMKDKTTELMDMFVKYE